MSISSGDDTNSPKQSDGEYDLENNSDVDLHLEDNVDALDGVDLDGDVDMAEDGDDDEEEGEEEEDEEEEQEGDEEKEEDEDDGKEPQKIGQGEMVNTSAENVATMVDDQPTVPPEYGQEMRGIPHSHNLQCLPHGQIPRSLAHDHTLWWCIPSVGCSSWDLWGGKNVTQQRQLWEKLWRPQIPWMSMKNSRHCAIRQVATVSPMSLSPNILLSDVVLPDVPLPGVPLPDVPLT